MFLLKLACKKNNLSFMVAVAGNLISEEYELKQIVLVDPVYERKGCNGKWTAFI